MNTMHAYNNKSSCYESLVTSKAKIKHIHFSDNDGMHKNIHENVYMLKTNLSVFIPLIIKFEIIQFWCFWVQMCMFWIFRTDRTGNVSGIFALDESGLLSFWRVNEAITYFHHQNIQIVTFCVYHITNQHVFALICCTFVLCWKNSGAKLQAMGSIDITSSIPHIDSILLFSKNTTKTYKIVCNIRFWHRYCTFSMFIERFSVVL